MNTCRKIPYPDRKTAESVRYDLKSRSKSDKKPNKRAKPYLCKRCGQWHLTTMTKREYKLSKKRSKYN